MAYVYADLFVIFYIYLLLFKMKKLWLLVVIIMSFGITACTNKPDFETYVSDVMHMYDDIDSSLSEITETKNVESGTFLDEIWLEDLLIFYSDLSVKLWVVKGELDLIWKYGSDKFLYNAAYKYFNTIQNLYQNELHSFIMLYARYQQDPWLKDQVLENFATLLLKIQNNDIVFTDDLNAFIKKHEDLN